MQQLSRRTTLYAFAALALMPATARAQYKQVNLVSDGAVPAAVIDPSLVNPWGISFSATSPFWISDNGAGVSTLYKGDGTKIPLTVTIPGPTGSPSGFVSAPTGQVENGSRSFQVKSGDPAIFIFATEDGTISGWNPAANPTTAILKVDNSTLGAVYKGLARGNAFSSGRVLYATDFHNARINVFDEKFKPITVAGGFVDPGVPAGYAPFGIRNIGNYLYVTYAVQNAAAHDDVAGPGNGLVDIFDQDGFLIKRLVSNGVLNSPWGLAQAPANFGIFSNMLLVGNFGDGRINVFDPASGDYMGAIDDMLGNPITLEGLWAITFGSGTAAGATNKLYFTSGPGNPPGSGMNIESHGLVGDIELGP